jgi:hypothetical protein
MKAMSMAINPALIGKAGEVLVAGELLRQGVEVAYPASDVGVDLLAYRLAPKETVAARFVPIQVKTRAKSGFNFQRAWFERVPGVVLIHVWNVETIPEFYIFPSIYSVEKALGPVYATSPSWVLKGLYNVSEALPIHYERMSPHRNQWKRITDQLITES